MKEKRNDLAPVNSEKETISTLELKKLCQDKAERMVLKVLCLSRGKPPRFGQPQLADTIVSVTVRPCLVTSITTLQMHCGD